MWIKVSLRYSKFYSDNIANFIAGHSGGVAGKPIYCSQRLVRAFPYRGFQNQGTTPLRVLCDALNVRPGK